ncbi:MAG: prephenate dehydratase [Rhodocyclaceae bacterium]|nr:prephenate dehydratase [Rhodocyclaceae bacterium]MCA3033454.1 prephenate dehydratase [Rhodocyclaceae bacterium]MCA3038337.1 prephenate dehydratase [Rhodocyclaceae bacterium]MCA3047401.1 prephenate dehydratase [Rhodocyclaceae bacterium]MCA3049339.1 prephenate dehydratase [Rhodocyclaceae bacterium]
MTADLQKLRQQIDALDAEILQKLNERAAFARKVGSLKVGQAYRPEREAEVLLRIKQLNQGPLPDEVAARLFREIMSACLALERPITVSYLGPQGTFSELAAKKHFGEGAELKPQGSIDEVYRSVESNACDFGVIPVENSTEGAVGRSLDLMPQTPLKICGEVLVRIHHHLMASAPLPYDSILKVFSHGQSLAQCHEWLNSNLPKAERIAVASNAEAARRASLEPFTAAVAGEMAATHYGLSVLASNIEDEPNNTTRFLVLGTYEPKLSGRDKTSLVLSAANRSGAVYEMLTPFAQRGVSMSKFESRPSKLAIWEYLFFVDIEGHVENQNVADALAELRKIAGYVKVLGSYPAAVL